MVLQHAGVWYVALNPVWPTARVHLFAGQENFRKLVTLVGNAITRAG